MFTATWFSPHKGEVGTLRLRRDPLRHGLGLYEDADGVVWDVCCVQGNGGDTLVNARRVAENPRYYGTAVGDGSDGFHTWPPYRLEVVGGGA